MTSITFLQIFLLVDFFIIGMLSMTAIRHAYAHFRPAKHEPEKPHSSPASEGLPPAVKEQLIKASEAQFQAILKQSTEALHKDLGTTTNWINTLVRRLATDIVGTELERYRLELVRLQKQAATDLGGIKEAMAGHEDELKAKAAEALEAEKQRLIKQIDTKLGDAVASFLAETLQHNVDLGGQSAYLMTLLEEHKADFVQEVADEAQPAK